MSQPRLPLVIGLLTAALVALTFPCADVAAQKRFGRPQDDRDRYPPVPFRAADLEALFKQQLDRSRDLEAARKLLDNVRNIESFLKNDKFRLPPDFKIDNIDPASIAKIAPALKGVDLKNIEKSVRAMSSAEQRKLLESLAPVRDQVQKLIAETREPTPTKEAPPQREAVTAPDTDEGDDPPWYTEEGMRALVQGWLEDIDQSQLGRWLRDSQGWQDAFRELQNQLSSADGGLDFALDLGLLEKGWDGLSSLPTPTLPSIALPSLRWRGFSGPTWGGGGGGISTSAFTGLVWVLLAVCVLVAAWHVLKNFRSRPAGVPSRHPGPWPVDVVAIATRTELRLAFEHLALLRLGENVRTWNHRQIALTLERQIPSNADAVAALAGLYEMARYTPGPEALTPAETAAARGSLRDLVPAETSRRR